MRPSQVHDRFAPSGELAIRHLCGLEGQSADRDDPLRLPAAVQAWGSSLLCLILVAIAAPAHGGIMSCNVGAFTQVAEITLESVRYLDQGNTVRAVLQLWTGPIRGGTSATFSRVRWDLTCQDMNLPCKPAEAVLTYEGDEFISTGCPVSWTSNSKKGQSIPNDIIFTPSQPLTLQAMDFTGCKIAFNVKVAKLPSNGALSLITVGGVVRGDVQCDNGMVASGTPDPLPSWPFCPTCDTVHHCGQYTGACIPDELQPGKCYRCEEIPCASSPI